MNSGNNAVSVFDMQKGLEASGGLRGARTCIIKPNPDVSTSGIVKTIQDISSYRDTVRLYHVKIVLKLP